LASHHVRSFGFSAATVILLACGLSDTSAQASSISTCTLDSITSTNTGDNSSLCVIQGSFEGIEGGTFAQATAGPSGFAVVSTIAAFGYGIQGTTQSLSASIDSTFYYYSDGPARAGTITLAGQGQTFYGGPSSIIVSDGVHNYTIDCDQVTCPTAGVTETGAFDLGSDFTVEVISGANYFGSLGTVGVDLPEVEVNVTFTLDEPDGTVVPSLLVPAPEPATFSACGLFLLAGLFAARLRPLVVSKSAG
jgi:hypothetical protein